MSNGNDQGPLIVDILPNPAGGWNPVPGPEANSIALPDEARQQIIEEALRVLRRCIAPDAAAASQTGLVVGYPYTDSTPHAVGVKRLGRYRGSHGVKLSQFPVEQRMLHLPSYARTEENKFPDWKIQFIRQNRELYRDNRSWIDAWMPEVLAFPSSLQKLEWNCKGGKRDIWSYVVQFRASGVRIKQPSSSPSLVAMTTTQVPIIAWQKRYMTPRECARLQSLGDLKRFLTHRLALQALHSTTAQLRVDIILESSSASRIDMSGFGFSVGHWNSCIPLRLPTM
jgi:hypothetical protein